MATPREGPLTDQHWQDLVHFHTTDVESLFEDDIWVGGYPPDYTDLLTASTHEDCFELKCMRDKRTGDFLYFKEVLDNPLDTQDK